MHLIITDAWLAKSKAIHLSGTKLFLACALAALALITFTLVVYHGVFIKGAREGWPIVGDLVKHVASEESNSRDRYVRENIDAIAKQIGEMQTKLAQLDSLGERVAGLAGISASEINRNAAPAAGRGGALISTQSLTVEDLKATLTALEQHTGQRIDLLTVVESRLFESKIKKLLIPTQRPAQGSEVGSAFGWRNDPFSGGSALHTGLDFPASPGTDILAAAGGVVVAQEYHSAYGNMVEIDHGNDLVTRYAHASRVLVNKGDLIKRGQKVAEVGTTGRSTGPHLHFEVLVQGIPQDPQKFLNAGESQQAAQLAQNRPALKQNPKK